MENVIVEAYGLKYVVDKNAKFIVEESYEPFMKDLVKLKPGNVFVDVGAHVGKYSFYAAKQVGANGLVIAIEPHPKNAENLRKGIELNGLTNIEVVEKACSNYSGTGFLIEYELSARHELSMETAARAVHNGEISANATNFTRNIVNTTPDDCYPEIMANIAESLAKNSNLKCKILKPKALRKEKMERFRNPKTLGISEKRSEMKLVNEI